ncbi:ABC transporter permease [Cohnella rhizosphaerae]|uniref:Transport permease protein n=1 Tax=Cohnella rhizosphaerae TaxID=1457232 RepID=A0A9X4QUS4_9BACL|nr:ABC transporter permease [Cohnella rhizosphaerae]MDG0811814.1 ABC transporter permease [Cohnella rhizosphaerae]
MLSTLKDLIRHRQLLWQFSNRDVAQRYKGSYFGLTWALIQPLLMLVVYSFVFTQVFKVKWGTGSDMNQFQFAITMFAGLIVFQIFSDPVYRSTSILQSNPNFIKRVVFPLEILPISSIISSFILQLFSIVIYLVALLCFGYSITWSWILAPISIIPVIILSAGISLLISSLSVFFRDVGQIISIVMNILFYISPVFYPVTAVPEAFRPYMYLNPLTTIIETFRATTMGTQDLKLLPWFEVLGVSIVIFLIGSYIFKISKENFADVI